MFEKYIKKTLFLLAMFFCLATVMATPLGDNGKLRVSGLQLVNECGHPVLLRGICGHGLQWFPGCMDNQEAVNFMAQVMGAELFRIPNIIPAGYSGYLQNPEYWKKEINKIVDLCEEKGIYVLIDWHVLYSGDPMIYVEEAKEFWQSMAITHAGKKHVIYDICNEPNGGTATWSRVKEYANIIIPAIRAIDPDTVIIVGTPNYSGDLSGPASDPLPYSNLMYALHFYAASPYHHMSERLVPYINKIPIFASEWGTSSHTGDYPLDLANSDAWLDYMEGNNPAGVKISWAIWSIGDKQEGSSILLPGTCPGPFGLDRLTETGNWLYNRLKKPNPFISCGIPALKGDVNGDGAVNIVDALMVAQYSTGLTPHGFIQDNGDVNNDGSITIIDALMIAQYYVGIIPSL